MTVALVIYLWLMGGILSAASVRFDDQDLSWKAALLYLITWPLLVPAVIIAAVIQRRLVWKRK